MGTRPPLGPRLSWCMKKTSRSSSGAGRCSSAWSKRRAIPRPSPVSYTGDVKAEGAEDRYTFKTWFNYADSNGVMTDRDLGGSGQYDLLSGENNYCFLSVGAEADEQARLDLRYRGGAGIGYTFYDTEEFQYFGEAGLTYIKEKFDVSSAPAGTRSESDEVALQLGHKLGWVLSDRTRFKQGLDAYPNLEDSNDVLVRVDSRIETNLTESMLASARYVLDWDNEAGLRGAERDDHRIVLSLGWSW
jgi:hypothetical protein